MKELVFKLAVVGCLISLGVNASMQNQRLLKVEMESLERDMVIQENASAQYKLLMTLSEIVKGVLHLNEGEEI